jgi:protein-S-isoprenylcysteine O-methyltransferase Ste14/RimJ/RimL family protein N-acetyltransferase
MSNATKPARILVAERAQRATMPALIVVVYAAAVYLFFLAVLAYAVGFFAGFGVPKGIDQGPRAATPVAVAIDLLLLLLFAVQHTVMARPWFKRPWTRIVPALAERTTFVLAASLVLALLFWLWRPIGGMVWNLSGPGVGALRAVYAAGWVIAASSTFLISHFDMFGLRQAWLHARRIRYSPPPFTQRGLYGRMRHPLMTGFVVVFWSAPAMTAGHLLFAAAATGYILVGIAFEEHDLIRSLGDTYADYRARVPALFPLPLAPASFARVMAVRRKRQEAGDMNNRTVITPAAEPARAEGRAAVSAWVGMFAPSGLPAVMTAVAGLAAGRRLIRVPGGRTVVLRDGSAVRIRPVRSADAPLLADGFGRLSAASRQMRFLGVKKELSAAELRYLTDVDHHDHEALGAVDQTDGRGVGIARFIRDAEDRRAAEIAVTIVDDWQGRGLGTELLARLSDRARSEGIRRFTALADAENVAVAALLRNAGAHLVRRGRGTVEYEITLTSGEARGLEGSSETCVSRSAGQAASGAISAAGSPGPERECALSPAARPPADIDAEVARNLGRTGR